MMELVIAKMWVSVFKNLGPGVLIGKVKVGVYVVGGSYLTYYEWTGGNKMMTQLTERT